MKFISALSFLLTFGLTESAFAFSYKVEDFSSTKEVNGVNIEFFGQQTDIYREIPSDKQLKDGIVRIDYADSGYIPTGFSFDYGGAAGQFKSTIKLNVKGLDAAGNPLPSAFNQFGTSRTVGSLTDNTDALVGTLVPSSTDKTVGFLDIPFGNRLFNRNYYIKQNYSYALGNASLNNGLLNISQSPIGTFKTLGVESTIKNEVSNLIPDFDPDNDFRVVDRDLWDSAYLLNNGISYTGSSPLYRGGTPLFYRSRTSVGFYPNTFTSQIPLYGAFSEIEFSDPSPDGDKSAAIGNLELNFTSFDDIISNSKLDITIGTVLPNSVGNTKASITAIAEFMNSSGDPIPLEVLAEAKGYSHFNWLNVISSVPKGTDVRSETGKQVVDNGKILTSTGKFFDPLFKGQQICPTGTFPCGNKLVADTKDFYYDVPGAGMDDYLSDARRGLPINLNQLRFFDAPFLTTDPNKTPFTFQTILVGVKKDDPTYETYEPINGMSFKWETVGNCKSDKCKQLTQINRLKNTDTLFVEELLALGLVEGEDFTFNTTITDDQVFFDEYEPELISLLQSEGGIFPSSIDTNNGNPSVRSTPESQSLIALIALVAFGVTSKRKKK